MSLPHEPPTSDSRLVWERPEPTSRPTPAPLSRERIVWGAIGIADQDGLARVSLRNVGAALNAGPMRLYGYLSTKEELLALMVDAVYGEIGTGWSDADGWREGLRAMAYETRAAAHRHHWFPDLLGGRPHYGPNALAHLEASLGVLVDRLAVATVDHALSVLKVFNSFVIGAVQNEAAERRAERESGLTKEQWQAATGAYMQRVIETGRFPLLARVINEVTHPTADAVFEFGLRRTLDGITASFRATECQ